LSAGPEAEGHLVLSQLKAGSSG